MNITGKLIRCRSLPCETGEPSGIPDLGPVVHAASRTLVCPSLPREMPTTVCTDAKLAGIFSGGLAFQCARFRPSMALTSHALKGANVVGWSGEPGPHTCSRSVHDLGAERRDWGRNRGGGGGGGEKENKLRQYALSLINDQHGREFRFHSKWAGILLGK